MSDTNNGKAKRGSVALGQLVYTAARGKGEEKAAARAELEKLRLEDLATAHDHTDA